MPRRSTLLLVAGAALAQPAASEISEVAPDRYVCEAPAGQQDGIDVAHVFAGSWMAARIRFLAAHPHPQGPTAAGLIFHLDSGNTAAVLLIAPESHPDEVSVVLKPPGNDEAVAMVSRRRTSTVEMSATMRRGAVFVRVGSERGQIYVADARLVRRQVICTSGRFEIELTRNPRRARPY